MPTGNPLDLADIRPVILSVEVRVPSGADAEASALPLMNAEGEPMEIHEFRFSVRPPPEVLANGDLFGRIVTGGHIGVSLSVKDSEDAGFALTNGPIPLWGFGPARQLGEEERNAYPPSLVATTNLPYTIGTYSWKLDHPMYVPPGGRIVPIFRSLGAFPADCIVSMVAVGKVLEHTQPLIIRVPWVCNWLSKSFNFNETGNDISPENALVNPHDKAVTIERFVGRIHMLTDIPQNVLGGIPVNYVFVADANTNDAATVTLFPTYFPPGDEYYSRFFRVTMVDSMGNPLVRRPTLFRSVFEAQTRSWEVRAQLPSKQYHKLSVFKTAPALPAMAYNSSRARIGVSSIGWHDVVWRKEDFPNANRNLTTVPPPPIDVTKTPNTRMAPSVVKASRLFRRG